MRKPLIAGNWKMFKTVSEARHLVSELVPALEPLSDVDRVLCPPFTSLLAVAALLEGSQIGLGAQNMHWESSGAFTGEVSPVMVSELCRYVILGHSERRTYFGETDEIVNRKVKAALDHALIPIVCVGETLEQYEAGQTREIVYNQILESLDGLALTDGESLVIAYEPVWAIGTGKASTGEDANQVIGQVVRPALHELFGNQVSQSVQVLYGGSVKADNAEEFFSQPEIDGALVGGASLKTGEFVGIVQAAVKEVNSE
jgi:triosephosphate isomerase (TIM)